MKPGQDLTTFLGDFEQMVEDEQDKLDFEADVADMADDIEKEIGIEDPEKATTFAVMQMLMNKYKDFCDACGAAWKIEELPPAVRKMLITLDQVNQERYQKMFLMLKKFANEMKQTEVKELPEQFKKIK